LSLEFADDDEPDTGKGLLRGRQLRGLLANSLDGAIVKHRAGFHGRDAMGLILLLLILVLLFGGGGFYMGPPYHYYGGGLGTILIIVIVVLLLRG